MKPTYFIIALILSTMLCSCTHQQASIAEHGDTLKIKYAEHLLITEYRDYHIVEIKNPWQKDKVLHTYVLVNRKDSATTDLTSVPNGSTVIYVPVKKVISFNTAHAYLMGEIGAVNQLVGVADLKFMLLPEIHRRVKEGLIADCGDAMSPNIEKIIMLNPDAILLSPFENSSGYGRLEDIGTSLIECADYMESSALGRAEWMKFYGMLLGKEQETDSLFQIVDSTYHALRSQYGQSNKKPQLLTEKLMGSTWYVPGGKSPVAQLIADAGGTYAWADDTHNGSLSLPFETILAKAGTSDVWIMSDYSDQPMTYTRLANEYHGYTMLNPFKKRRIWYVNSLQVPYFEEIPFRPERLLRDYIIMLHPELKLGHPRYYRQLGIEK